MTTAAPLFRRRLVIVGQYGYSTVFEEDPGSTGVSDVMTGLTRAEAQRVVSSISNEIDRFVELNNLGDERRRGARRPVFYKFQEYAISRGGRGVWNVVRTNDDGTVSDVVWFSKAKMADKWLSAFADQLRRFRQDNRLLMPGESDYRTKAVKAAIAAAIRGAKGNGRKLSAFAKAYFKLWREKSRMGDASDIDSTEEAFRNGDVTEEELLAQSPSSWRSKLPPIGGHAPTVRR